MSGFQNVVNVTPAPAVAGDFASENPRASVLFGPGGAVAGAGGVTVGQFAWVANDGNTVYNYGTNPNVPAGFIHRDMQALIQTYLGEFSNNIPVGFGLTLFNEGDFWAINNGPSASTINEQVYARFSDGAIFVGSAPTGASATGAMGSTNTASLGATFTATGVATALTTTAVTGLISVGDEIAGTGVTAGTTILAQVSGTTGGAGVYTTSAATTSSGDTVTSFGDVVKVTATTGLISIGETISGGAGFPVGATVATQVSGTTGGAGVYTISAPGTAYTASATGVTTFGNRVNVSSVASGILAVGDPITGTGIPASSVIASQVSGTTGSAGIYTLSNSASAYAASTALTTTGGISVTGWKAKSVGAVGELIKISTWG